MIKNYFVSMIVFICVDSFWLGLIAPKFYRAHIGHLMSDTPDLMAAALFYMIFLFGLNVFVIQAKHGSSNTSVMKYAFLFGVVTYATFDLTSVAVFKDFPYLVAAVDLLWGGVLSTLVAVITLQIDSSHKKKSMIM